MPSSPVLDDEDVETSEATPKPVELSDGDVDIPTAAPAAAIPSPQAAADPQAAAPPPASPPALQSGPEQPAGAVGPLPTVAGVPQPQMTVPSLGQTLTGQTPKAAPPADSYDYGGQSTDLAIEGLKQLGQAWGDDNTFNSKDAKQGLTKAVNGIMGGLGSTMIGGSGAGLVDAAGVKGLMGRAGPQAARALAAAIAGGYVTGKAARYGVRLLGLDPDAQDLAEALGNVAGGLGAAHATGGHGAAREQHPASTEDLHPDYQAYPELTAGDVEEPEEEKEEEKEPVKPAAKPEEPTHPAGKVTAIDQETNLPIVDRSKPSAETDEARPETPKGEVLAPEKNATEPEAKKEPVTLEGKIGDKDPGSGRVITQPSTDLAVAQKSATEAAPELKDKLAAITKDVPGAKVAGVRDTKDQDRATEKIEKQGQPVQTVSDLLAGRIAVDSPEAKDQVVAALRSEFPVLKEEDRFDRGDPSYGFRSHDIQVQVGKSSAEVQVVPREIAEAESDTHENYEQGREAEIQGRTADAQAAQAKNRKIHDAAMEKFTARQPLQLTDGDVDESKSNQEEENAAPEQPSGATVKTEAPAALKKGSAVLLPDGRAGTVDFHDARITGRARVTAADGEKMASIPGKSLTPIAPLDLKFHNTGTELEKKTEEYTKANATREIAGVIADSRGKDGVPSISTDLAKNRFPEYRKDPVGAEEDVRGSAHALADAAWRTLLAQPVDPTKPYVIIQTGSPASGKSTGNEQTAGKVALKREMIVTSLPDARRAIKEIIDSGRQPVLQMAFVDSPTETVTRMVKRAVGDKETKGIGRVVPIPYMARTYVDVPKNVALLEKEFGNQLTVNTIDNSGKPGQAKAYAGSTAANVNALKWTEQTAKEAMLERLERLREEGKISGAHYLKARGGDTPAGGLENRAGDSGRDEQAGSQQAGKSLAQKDNDTQERGASSLPESKEEKLLTPGTAPPITDRKDEHMTRLYDDKAVAEPNTGKIASEEPDAKIPRMNRESGAGDKGTQPKQETPAGAIKVRELKTPEEVTDVLSSNAGKNLFVRSSSGPTYDLKQKFSRDYQTMQRHLGLSAVWIDPGWLNEGLGYALHRITEYGHRWPIKGVTQRLWIYEGKELGKDTDGYESIEVLQTVAVLSKDLVKNAERIYMQDRIAGNKRDLARLTDRFALQIVAKNLAENEKKLAGMGGAWKPPKTRGASFPDPSSSPGGGESATIFRSGFLDPELFKELFPQAVDRVAEWLNGSVTEGDKQKETMRETRGQMDRRVAMVMEKLDSDRKRWSLRSRDDSKAFWNAIENGKIDSLPAKDQHTARFLASGYDKLVKDIQALKPEALQNLIQNYFPHIWERPAHAKSVIMRVLNGKKPFAGRASFLKQRTIPTMQDGIDLGLKPKTWNPIEMFVLKYAEMAQFLMGHQTLDAMKKMDTAKFVGIGKKAPEGWTQLDDRIGTVQQKLDDGNLAIRGYYYAPADAARAFNNFVSRGMAGRSGLYDTLAWMNNNMNALQLGISAFHATTTSVNAATSEIALAIKQLSEGKPIKAAGHFISGATTIPSIVRTAINGRHLMQEYLQPGSYDKFSKEAEMLAAAGGRIKQNSLELKPFAKMVNALRNGAVGEGLSAIPGAILHATVAPVMEHWVPWMKMGAFYDMAHDAIDQGMRRNWSKEEIRRQVQKAWDSTDDRFGQLVYDNLFWHKGLRDAMQLAVRSVGWNFGTFRTAIGATTDTIREANKGLHGELLQVSDRMAFAFALPLYTALVGAVLTYLWQHKKPSTWKDYFYPQRADGTRVSIPGYMKDVVAFGQNPAGTVLNKMSPIIEATSEAIQNKDFYGTEIRHKDDPAVKQFVEFAKWAAGINTPFAVSGTQKLLEKEGEDASMDWKHPLDSAKRIGGAILRHPGDMVLGNFGFQKAPAYIQNSPALNLAREYGQSNRTAGTRTQAQTDRVNAMHAIEDAIRSGKPNYALEKQYVDTGKISKADVFKARMYAKTDPLVSAVRSLPIEQAINVYAEGDAREQTLLRPVLAAKKHTINNMTDPDKRLEVQESYRRAMGDSLPTVARAARAGGT